MKFLKELFNRFGLQTPSFFQIFQKLGIIATALTGIPLLLTTFQTDLGITLPDVVHVLSQKAALGGAIIMWIMAKLPANNSTKIAANTDKLPFTQKKIEEKTP